MAKSFYTQCSVLLLNEAITIEEIESLIDSYKIVKKEEATKNWQFSGPSIFLPYDPDNNGYCQVDVVDNKWPDDMGKEDPATLGAWALSHFGPFSYSHGLERAIEECWYIDNAKQKVMEHNAFIRVRISYAFGKSGESLSYPENMDAIRELEFIAGIIKSLIQHPNVICYFNPNGEVLMDKDNYLTHYELIQNKTIQGMNIWFNIRISTLDSGIICVDQVGAGQIDLYDQEMLYQNEEYDEQAYPFILDQILFMIDHGLIKNGYSTKGPGNINWIAAIYEESLLEPPRHVIRWFPDDQSMIPDKFVNGNVDHLDDQPWWKSW